jgi:hypothetical protein
MDDNTGLILHSGTPWSAPTVADLGLSLDQSLDVSYTPRHEIGDVLALRFIHSIEFRTNRQPRPPP